MSSENRRIRLNTLERDVPPLNRIRGANRSEENSRAKVQHTQKSFSTAAAGRASRAAACAK